MNGINAGNGGLVVPDPLLDRYGDTIRQVPSLKLTGGTMTTVSRGINRAVLAFQKLVIGKEDARSRADADIDALFSDSLSSRSGRDIIPVLFSDSETGRVYSVDRPFGLLDKAFKYKLNFTLIIKEYFTREKVPDVQRITRNAALYSALYEEWKRDGSFPQAEIFARTDRRLLCTRDGENLGFEFASPDDMMPAVIAESRILTDYLSRNPRLTLAARIDPYAEKFTKSALALAPYVPSQKYAAAVAKDAMMLASRLGSEPLVPHIDPTSINLVVENGRLRFIDLEKATEYLVSESHLRAHIWFDPSYSLPFKAREEGLGGLDGALYYLVRRAARGLVGRQWAPLPAWVDIVDHRYAKNVENLALIGQRSGYESARMLADVDAERLKSDFSKAHLRKRSEMDYHRRS